MSGVPLLLVFILDSYDENIIPFLEAQTSAVSASGLGWVINKTIVQHFVSKSQVNFTTQKADKFIVALNELVLEDGLTEEEQYNLNVKKDAVIKLKSFYIRGIMNYEDFNDKLTQIINDTI